MSDRRGSEFLNDRIGQSLPAPVREAGETIDAVLKAALETIRERDQVRLVSAFGAHVVNGQVYLTLVAVMASKDGPITPWSPHVMATTAEKLIRDVSAESRG